MAFGAGRFVCSAHGILRLLQKAFSNMFSLDCITLWRSVFGGDLCGLSYQHLNYVEVPQPASSLSGGLDPLGLVAVWSHSVVAARQLPLQLPGRSAGKVDSPDTSHES